MVRPRKCRRVGAAPDVTYFKPRGVPLRGLSEVHLSVDGYEALRLADYQGLKHEEAAVQMQVSRQTFSRVLAQARKTVADALVSGFALRIRGGDYVLSHAKDCQESGTDPNHGRDDILQEVQREGASLNSAQSCKEGVKMKRIAISSQGPALDDELDPRFGRAAGFIVVDPETLDFVYIDNGASQARGQGAGIQAAESVAASGAEVVLTGYAGPKAFAALQAAGIKVGQNLNNMTVRQAIEAFRNQKVDWSQQPKGKGRLHEGRHRQRQGRNW